MTELATTAAVVESEACTPASSSPAGAVFLSTNGRRRRVLAIAGQATAGLAVLWVAALVAGALGIVTPGALSLPGLGHGHHAAAPASKAAAHLRAVKAAARRAGDATNATPSPSAASRTRAASERAAAVGSAHHSIGATGRGVGSLAHPRPPASTGTVSKHQSSTGTVSSTVSHHGSSGTHSAPAASQRTTAPGSGVSAEAHAKHDPAGSTTLPTAPALPGASGLHTSPLTPGHSAK
jgi:hypothetical protein